MRETERSRDAAAVSQGLLADTKWAFVSSQDATERNSCASGALTDFI